MTAQPQEDAGAHGVRVPVSVGVAELRERGSRFLALVEPLSEAAGARARLAELAREHRDATHLCWAWRLLEPVSERCSDAGEPAGTAGAPILRALTGAGLRDVLAVVVRWYGGTKLGKGGLARAYAEVTRAALAEIDTEERRPSRVLEVCVPYAAIGGVQRLVQPPAVVVEKSTFEGEARFRLRVWRGCLPRVLEALAALGAETRSVERDGDSSWRPRPPTA